MAIELIDTITPKNGQNFAIALSNEIKGGIHQKDTFDEMLAIPTERRQAGMICYVKADQFYKLEDDLITWTGLGSLEDTKAKEYNTLEDLKGIAPSIGQFVYIKEDTNMYYWDGEQWVVFGERAPIDTTTIATKEDLLNYPTKEELTNELSNYSTKEELSSYATKEELRTELSTYATKEELSNYSTKQELSNAVTSMESYVDNAIDSETIFDNTENTVTSIGGIPSGSNLNGLTIKEILNKLLFPYVAPTLSASLTYSPSGSVFEYGQTVLISEIKGTVTKKSEAITSIRFLDNTTVLTEITNGVGSSGSYKHTFTEQVRITSPLSSSRFRFSVTDASGKTYYVNTTSLNFYYPYYIGVIGESETINANVVKSLTKKVEAKGNKANNFTTNNQRMVIAYPKSYGNLTKILDANSFDVTSTFTKTELSLECLDGTVQQYYVYVNNASTVTNFKMTFYY